MIFFVMLSTMGGRLSNTPWFSVVYTDSEKSFNAYALSLSFSSPSQRPSFEHAGLTCYTLLSPSITFSLFHSELKTYYLFRKSYPPP